MSSSGTPAARRYEGRRSSQSRAAVRSSLSPWVYGVRHRRHLMILSSSSRALSRAAAAFVHRPYPRVKSAPRRAPMKAGLTETSTSRTDTRSWSRQFRFVGWAADSEFRHPDRQGSRVMARRRVDMGQHAAGWFGGPSSLGAHRCPSRPVGCCCGHHGSRVVDQQPAWIGWLLTFVGLVAGYFYPPKRIVGRLTRNLFGRDTSAA